MKISMKALYCISTIGLIAHESACGTEEKATALKQEVIALANKIINNEQIIGQINRWHNDEDTYDEELTTLNSLQSSPDIDNLTEFVTIIKNTNLPKDSGVANAKPYKTIDAELKEAKLKDVTDLNTFLSYLEGDHFSDLRLEPMEVNVNLLDNSYMTPKLKSKIITIMHKKNEILTEQQQKDKLKEVMKSELIIKNITKEQIAEALKEKVKHDIPEDIINKMITEHADNSSEKKEIVALYGKMIERPEIAQKIIEHNYGEEIEEEIYKKLQKLTISTTKAEIAADVKQYMIQEITEEDLKPYASIQKILTEHSIKNETELPAGKEKNISNIYGEAQIIQLIAEQQQEIENASTELKNGIHEFNSATHSTYPDTYTLTSFLQDLANTYNAQKKKVIAYNALKKGGKTGGLKGNPASNTKEVNDLKQRITQLEKELKEANKNPKVINKPTILLTQEEKSILIKQLGNVNDKPKAKAIAKKLGLE